MEIHYHKSWSPSLDQDIELKIYGNSGKPVVVFPTQGGRFYDYEDNGMVHACARFISAGIIQLYTVDSIDHQSWANWDIHPSVRAIRHEAYDRYILQEVLPFIRDRNPEDRKCLATGCSMGAYHAANFFFRHPDMFDAVIALSGMYRLNFFIGDYMDQTTYFNSPLSYLPNLEDSWYIDQYRESDIIICAGQGAWEEPMVEDTLALKQILADKHIPALVDLWGYDVNHDWPWWKRMMPYFLENVFLKN